MKSFFSSHGCFKGNSQNLGMKAEKFSPIIKKMDKSSTQYFIFLCLVLWWNNQQLYRVMQST